VSCFCDLVLDVPLLLRHYRYRTVSTRATCIMNSESSFFGTTTVSRFLSLDEQVAGFCDRDFRYVIGVL
jgi:hypothetical protein